MNLFRASICFLILGMAGQVYAQDYYSVIAKSGLSVRENPSLTAKRIGKLKFNEVVELVKKTDKTLSILDDGKMIHGSWVEVESSGKGGIRGYVFGGFLLEKENSIENEYFNCEEKETCSSKFLYDNFDVFIERYLIQGGPKSVQNKSDTIHAYEYVFNELSDKLLHIVPRVEVDSVNVFYTANETILEQWNDDSSQDWQEWNKTRVRWEGHEDFVRIPQKGLFFRIPVTAYKACENARKEKMALRDTFVNRTGEGHDLIATLIYKEKACEYWIYEVLLKIVIFHKNKEKETKYIEVTLSYGC